MGTEALYKSTGYSKTGSRRDVSVNYGQFSAPLLLLLIRVVLCIVTRYFNSKQFTSRVRVNLL